MWSKQRAKWVCFIFLCLLFVDGPAIRNANRGFLYELICANRFADQTNIFITSERFARIASNMRFAIFWCPETRSQKKGFSSGTLRRFARSKWFERICESIAWRIGPSKLLFSFVLLTLKPCQRGTNSASFWRLQENSRRLFVAFYLAFSCCPLVLLRELRAW